MNDINSPENDISTCQRRLQILACLCPRGLAQRLTELRSKLEEAKLTSPLSSALDNTKEGDGTSIPVPATRRRRRRNTARMDVCLHEAGHAVAHWYVGVPFEVVSVCWENQVPVEANGMFAGGSVTGFDWVPPRQKWLTFAEAGDPLAMARGRAATEMEMLCAYAGPFAQARYIYSDILRKPGQPPVRQRRVLDVDTILHAGGGAGDWWLIETDAAGCGDGGSLAPARRGPRSE